MHICLLGATGRVGSYILNYALADGHDVTALVRTPEKLQMTDYRLTVIQGNVLNQEDLTRAMRGADVVISALNTDGTTTLSESMPLIIEAMENEKIQRIITIGTAGILNSRYTPNALRYQTNESKQRSTRAAEEHERAYKLLQQSSLDWTIICPTYLPDGEQTGTYRVERDVLPIDGAKISTADTSAFAYKQIHSDEYIHARVGIAY